MTCLGGRFFSGHGVLSVQLIPPGDRPKMVHMLENTNFNAHFFASETVASIGLKVVWPFYSIFGMTVNCYILPRTCLLVEIVPWSNGQLKICGSFFKYPGSYWRYLMKTPNNTINWVLCLEVPAISMCKSSFAQLPSVALREIINVTDK